jgi:hypothetical protein
MGKLSLDLDALDVESFETEAEIVNRRGTVHAEGAPCTEYFTCLCDTKPYRCGPPSQYSCDYSKMTPCPSWCTEGGECTI